MEWGFDTVCAGRHLAACGQMPAGMCWDRAPLCWQTGNASFFSALALYGAAGRLAC